MNYKLNLIPIRISCDNITVYYSETEQDLPKVKKDTATDRLGFNGEIKNEWVYWDINNINDSSHIEYEFKKNRYFTQKILNRLLLNWFFDKSLIIERSFTNSIIIWEKIEEKSKYKKYKKFTLNVLYVESLSKWCIQICYSGISYTYLNNSNSKFSVLDINKVIRQNKVNKLKDKELNGDDEIILNNFLINKYKLEIPSLYYYESNKYKKYFIEIKNFIIAHLNDSIVYNIFEISSTDLLETFPANIGRINKDYNLLKFGNNILNYNIIDGLKNGGPTKLPENIDELKFIFIFQETDKDYANKLHSYFKKGYRNYPGLELFTGIKYSLDIDNSLKFKSEHSCIDELIKHLESLSNREKYFAIFITPTKKEDDFRNEITLYPEVKKTLLEYNISSQAVEKHKIYDTNFNFYLTNISIAIIAKNEGIPWTIPVESSTELVVGIGIYRSKEKIIIGNAVCFDNGGQFYEFETFRENEYELIFSSFKKYIEDYIKKNKQFQRILIHYYKQPGKREKKAISKIIDELDLSVPYYFITINETESEDYVIFDNEFSGVMPVSGTYYKLRKNCYILCNNSRYSVNTRQKIQDYHFPIKIYISTGNNDLELSDDVIKLIMSQIYQFSRMYWKSVKQQNLPVTIKYSKLIAAQISRFNEQKLPDTITAKETLWFL